MACAAGPHSSGTSVKSRSSASTAPAAASRNAFSLSPFSSAWRAGFTNPRPVVRRNRLVSCSSFAMLAARYSASTGGMSGAVAGFSRAHPWTAAMSADRRSLPSGRAGSACSHSTARATHLVCSRTHRISVTLSAVSSLASEASKAASSAMPERSYSSKNT